MARPRQGKLEMRFAVPARWGWLLPVALGALALWPVLTFDFTSWDDFATVARNPALLPPSAQALADAWTVPFMDLWVPLTSSLWIALASVAVHTVNGRIELSPAWFHATNLLVHLAAVGGVYALLRRLFAGVWPAVVGAAVFAVHPLQVETVAWVSGLKDLLAGLCAVLALWGYVVAAQAPERTPSCRRYYLLGTAALLLGLLSKPSVMVVPVMAGILDALVLRRRLGTVALWMVPWLVLAAPFAVIARFVQPAHVAQAVGVPFWARPLVAADALAFYLGKLLWPVGLTIDYGRTPASVLASGQIWWTWLVPATLAAALLSFRRRLEMPLVAGVLFVVALAPVLGLARFDFQAYSTVADHYLYLPMFAVALVGAWGVSRRPGRVAAIVAVLVLVCWGGMGWWQSWVWRDTSSLFTHALAINPRSWAAYTSLSAHASEQGDIPRALDLAQRAYTLNPDSANVRVNLAAALVKSGRVPEAIAQYRAALGIEAGNVHALASLGGLLAESGQIDEAERILRRAIEIAPGDATARLNLGTLYAMQDRLEDALVQLRAAARLTPNDPKARAHLGTVLLLLGRRDEAIAQLRHALRLSPDYPPAVAALRAAQSR